MNRVGEQKGESVWLGFFLCEVLNRFAPLVIKEVADELYAYRKELLQNIEQHAWDGDWYLRAWYDNGKPLGSRESLGCQIDNLAQSWSVLAGANPFRCARAVDSAWNALYDPDLKVMRLLHPPFDGGENPVYIAGYLPGVRENGGQYSHAVPWMIQALLELGDITRAWELIRAMLPMTHSTNRQEADRYRVEPYVLAADIYMNPDQMGRGGWTWYTGSAGWLYMVVLEGLLGFDRRGDHVRLIPKAPSDWPEFTVTLTFGRSTYHLTASRETAALILDGERVPETWITLQDDGRIHEARFPMEGNR
jgi:cellobiose phosphorylase